MTNFVSLKILLLTQFACYLYKKLTEHWYSNSKKILRTRFLILWFLTPWGSKIEFRGDTILSFAPLGVKLKKSKICPKEFFQLIWCSVHNLYSWSQKWMRSSKKTWFLNFPQFEFLVEFYIEIWRNRDFQSPAIR